MKYVLRICLLGLLASSFGCRSLDQALFTMPTAPLSTRLPVLKTSVEAGPLAKKGKGATSEDLQKLFQLELEQNLMDVKDTTTYGSIKLRVTKASAKRTGNGLRIFQYTTLLTPLLLGVPLEYHQSDLQAEVQVIDVHGSVLARYTGKGSSKVKVAMYHGYSRKGAPRLADVESVRQALNQIRPKVEADASSLRGQLIMTAYPNEVIIQEIPGMGGSPAKAAPDSTRSKAGN
ncbi:hypothetical protein [Hymenobacter cellulosivorans]|uniref:DUF4292 domain-containing protein n=1 Tax=Hymenobacter cellulosivorans TaxID=2932249 RepID=A0ABY4FHE0_9BACT|nr:hypothetical protein [Hymenobacter cellulosivorans]UOQ55379.1 hypothetical protein MUN80_11630 [Hymenobacter cellulosivorans]